MDSTANDRTRCGWSSNDPAMMLYHDREWGVPVHDDRTLFEFLVLEGAQAGLSWLTVLKRRSAYRKAFDNFDFKKIAKYDKSKIDKLVQDQSIIRNRLKIEATVANAKAFIAVRKEFDSFDKYIWKFVDDRPIRNEWASLKSIPAKTEISDKLSKDLINRGFKFVGSTICYAHMQATGMVNDHLVTCFRHSEV